MLVNVHRTQLAPRHEKVHAEYSLVGVDIKFTSFQTELQQAVRQFMANGTQKRNNVCYFMCMSYFELSYVRSEFYSFTCYTDGTFRSKFPFNPFTAMMPLKKTIKVRNLKPLSFFVFLFAHTCERIFIKTHGFQSRRVTGQQKHTVCRRFRASFSPDILQAGAVKGLRTIKYYLILRRSSAEVTLGVWSKDMRTNGQTTVCGNENRQVHANEKAR